MNRTLRTRRYTSIEKVFCSCRSCNLHVKFVNKSTTTQAQEERGTTTKTYYVSITGLKLKSIWYLLKFTKYSGPSMKQASSAPGNVSAEGNYRNGTLHTLSVWEDRKSMVKFMASGAHAQAMKITSEVSPPGGTKVYGYETTQIPTWNEAIDIWQKYGRIHGSKKNNDDVTYDDDVVCGSSNTSSSKSLLSYCTFNEPKPFVIRHKALVVLVVMIFVIVYF